MREAREVCRAALHPSMARRSGAHGLWPPAPPRGAGVAGGDLSAVSGLHPRATRAAAAPAARALPRAAGAPPPRRRGPGPSCAKRDRACAAGYVESLRSPPTSRTPDLRDIPCRPRLSSGSCPPENACAEASSTSVVAVQWVASSPWPTSLPRISLPLQPSWLLSLSSRPTWRDCSRARRLRRYSLVFQLRDLIQLGLHVGQCPEDLPPRFVLLLQAIRSWRMMRSVQGGMTLLEPLALHGFFQRTHHEVGFLHEFVDQMGPFPWFHVSPPFRRLVVPVTLLTQPALPFRRLKIFHEGTHLCQARAHPLPCILLSARMPT